jgi:hypothetical protein
MSYTFLLEQGEESSADSCSDIPQSVLSRLNLTAGKSCSKGSGTESCQSSQSGMMSAPLTELRGEEKSMSSAEDSRAQTLAQQEREPESPANEADCGQRCPESLAKYDLNTHSWRTHQCLLFEDLGECLETFPRWGLMRGGELWERTMPVLLTSVTESGSWPTPRVLGQESYETRSARKGHSVAMSYLESAVEYYEKTGARKVMFPTPQANEDAAGTPNGNMQKMLWNHPDIRGTTPEEWAGGTLNPTWVEWLMGWIIGFTDLKPLEMDKFQLWRHSHGVCSEDQ